MEIKPVDQTIKTLLESAFYRIPRFQRPYSWDQENVADFWNDAVVAEDPDYFIGSFVVYRSAPNTDTLLIVDGQQRITTITLLLAAIRDALSAGGHADLAKGVQGLIERPDINNERQYVLQSETPYPYLQEFIQKFGRPELAPSEGKEEEALRSAYSFVQAQVGAAIDAIDADSSLSHTKKEAAKRAKLVEIRDKLLRLQLILIQLGNEDDAYLIFETLNTRGKDLTVSDLVKNHLTRMLRPTNRGVDVARDKWNSILDLFDAASVDIDINRFLHHSWLSRRNYLPEKKLFREIKRVVQADTARAYLDQLVSDSKLYRQIAEPGVVKWPTQERQIEKSLRAINLFRILQSVPMLLAILRAYETDRLTVKQATSAVRALENFHVQFTAVTAQRTGGGTALMFALGARSLEQASDKNQAGRVVKEFVGKLRDRLPTTDEFAAGFAAIQFVDSNSKQRPLVRYLLSRFDELDRPGVVVSYDDMTVEHLAPQNPAGLADVSPELVGTMGNLVLVPQGLNNRLANKPFDAKRAELQEAGVPLDPLIQRARRWSDNEVRRRTLLLAERGQKEVFAV
jgi:hypothetical protein